MRTTQANKFYPSCQRTPQVIECSPSSNPSSGKAPIIMADTANAPRVLHPPNTIILRINQNIKLRANKQLPGCGTNAVGYGILLSTKLQVLPIQTNFPFDTKVQALAPAITKGELPHPSRYKCLNCPLRRPYSIQITSIEEDIGGTFHTVQSSLMRNFLVSCNPLRDTHLITNDLMEDTATNYEQSPYSNDDY